MATKSLALCLVDPSNDFQQLLQKDAEEAARRASASLVVRFSGHDLASQLKELDAVVAGSPRPDAILVLAVRDRGLDRVARSALKAGVSWAFLNRTEDDVEALRAAAPPGAIACTVCADELETGRIQGRQFRALLARRPGAKVLYVQGSRRSLAARDRTAGMEEAIKGSGLEVVLLEGGWTAAEARDAVRRWLGIAARGGGRIDLVGCQNDQIAQGTLEAFAEMARELARPELAQVVVTGCDGTPQLGQRLVKEGRLRATVALARSSGPAVELLVRALTGGTPPPPVTLLKGVSFPAEAALAALPPA
ncbi:MAG TPA: sugar ABC transporter substrate-binding protein [Vicinamibacteria bacterium]|nr:sugar ABC transporter substrate-binding protein [Vicinamibacteria bacterium]